MRTRFKNDDFQFGLEIALGSASRGASDPGEVLATTARIKDGDASASAGTARSTCTRSRASA